MKTKEKVFKGDVEITPANKKEWQLIVVGDKKTPHEEFRRYKNIIYLDLDKIQQPLIIRNRRDGDWFQPLGMPGRQKIKNLFIDNKIPRHEREGILLLVDQISVIWIENRHLSDRVKVTDKTKNVLKLGIVTS